MWAGINWKRVIASLWAWNTGGTDWRWSTAGKLVRKKLTVF